MIGNYIKGIDINNMPAEGEIIDIIIAAQMVNIKREALAPPQSLPMPLTAYLVYHEGTGRMAIISPTQILELSMPVYNNVTAEAFLKKTDL